MTIQWSYYHIESAASSSTVVDLSGGDKRSVLGYPFHGESNQRWELTPHGAGFSIRSVYNGVFLCLDLRSNSKAIIGLKYPVSWDITAVDAKDENNLYRIRWPDSQWVLTLGQQQGSQLRLAHQDLPTSLNQLWRFRLSSPAVPLPVLSPHKEVQPTTPSSANPSSTDSARVISIVDAGQPPLGTPSSTDSALVVSISEDTQPSTPSTMTPSSMTPTSGTSSSGLHVAAAILLPDDPEAPNICSKFIIKAFYLAEGGASIPLVLSINSDIAVPKFRSKGATPDRRTSQSLLLVEFKKWENVTGFAEFSGLIGAGQIRVYTDQDVLIRGPIEDGPRTGQRFVGTGTWTMA